MAGPSFHPKSGGQVAASPEKSNAVAALAADIGRQDADVQALFARNLESRLEELAERVSAARSVY